MRFDFLLTWASKKSVQKNIFSVCVVIFYNDKIFFYFVVVNNLLSTPCSLTGKTQKRKNNICACVTHAPGYFYFFFLQCRFNSYHGAIFKSYKEFLVYATSLLRLILTNGDYFAIKRVILRADKYNCPRPVSWGIHWIP